MSRVTAHLLDNRTSLAKDDRDGNSHGPRAGSGEGFDPEREHQLTIAAGAIGEYRNGDAQGQKQHRGRPGAEDGAGELELAS